MTKLLILSVLMVIVVLFLAGCNPYSDVIGKDKESYKYKQDWDKEEDVKEDTVESPEDISVIAGDEQNDVNCSRIPDYLDVCEGYICEFVHPFTEETMKKKVLGLVDGNCNYMEEMPNNYRLECQYTESMRKAVAQSYRDAMAAETIGIDLHIELGSGESEVTYTIDGKEVAVPLQEALDTGQCVILVAE